MEAMQQSGIKRLGVLTTGGDCAGLNAAIRAVVRRAAGHWGLEVYGIHQGTVGLMDNPPRYERLELGQADAALLRAGGTILGSVNRGDPFAYPLPEGGVTDLSAKIHAGVARLGLDAIIGIGGDGSMRIMHRLMSTGHFPFVGIPKTIDNDLGATEYAIGHHTAVEVAMEALDRLQPTAASHNRIMVLEVMGRDAGHIALAAGIAGGVDVILIPEIPWRMAPVAAAIKALRDRGRNFALVVVAEAVRTAEGETVLAGPSAPGAMPRLGGVGGPIAHALEEATGAEARVTVLGHVQRGGSPGALDRIVGSSMGVHAVDLAVAGRFGRIVVWREGRVADAPVEEAAGAARPVDPNDDMVRVARGLGICLGDQ
ncbi:ATP-dependent 6-phosphofructokinase [Elioraea rosea]|uniref:ATP-dependent 6-phosphofructokinase n=1 Tax=Elioraea rosea TaxID=2492390 RepID=UPI0011829AE9|nr:ATP-dependent 6-phosphofructokinase [Elioraea rosea]